MEWQNVGESATLGPLTLSPDGSLKIGDGPTFGAGCEVENSQFGDSIYNKGPAETDPWVIQAPDATHWLCFHGGAWWYKTEKPGERKLTGREVADYFWGKLRSIRRWLTR